MWWYDLREKERSPEQSINKDQCNGTQQCCWVFVVIFLWPMHTTFFLLYCFAWMATRHELSPDRITLLKQKRRAKKKARKQRLNAKVLVDQGQWTRVVDSSMFRLLLLRLQYPIQSLPTTYHLFWISLFSYHQRASGKHLDLLFSISLYPPWQQQQNKTTPMHMNKV